jgi:hypothetical protein
MPLARGSRTLAALVPYLSFNRDQPRYGSTAGWVKAAVTSFAEMPPKRKGTSIAPERIVTVLQGWAVTPEQRQAQIDRSREAGTKGYVVAEMKIDQAWEPRIVKAKLVKQSGVPANPGGVHPHGAAHH